MNLLKSKRFGLVTSSDLSESLKELNLKGKNVLIYSRLLSFGRFLGKSAITEFLEIIKNEIGSEGTLIIPTYTLNSYKEPRVFDVDKSVVMSGILGEIASSDPDFSRSIHPVYSNSIWGKYTEYLLSQDATTCFGENSFFDKFSSLDNAYVLMLGLNFNGPTLYHYYDQKFSAPGRFLKKFDITMRLGENSFNIKFESFVKDHTFYAQRMNCLARFDALAEELEVVDRQALGDNFMHGILEKDFQQLYKSALETDQNYFLLSSENDWEDYYMKNNFQLFHGTLEKDLVKKVRERFVR